MSSSLAFIKSVLCLIILPLFSSKKTKVHFSSDLGIVIYLQHLSFFFLPPNPSVYISTLSLKYMASFHQLLLRAYIHNKYKYIPLYLYICFQGRHFSSGQTIDVLFPEESHLSHSQHPSLAYSSLCRSGDSYGFAHLLWHVHWGHTYSGHAGEVMLEKLYVCDYYISRRESLTENSLIICLLQPLLPLSHNVP